MKFGWTIPSQVLEELQGIPFLASHHSMVPCDCLMRNRAALFGWYPTFLLRLFKVRWFFLFVRLFVFTSRLSVIRSR